MIKDYEKMTDEELEEIAGGSSLESFRLALVLTAKKYGNFVLKEPDPETHSQIDTDAMVTYFASRGYRFEPSSIPTQKNKFYTPEGNCLTHDEMMDLIREGKF